jgi:UDP-N-acetylmuramate dehydrogenase
MIDIKKNVPLAPYTYFKIGGPAAFFTEAKSNEELREALEWAHSLTLPFFILGAGSNILISDKGFSGLVVKMDMQGIAGTNERIILGAGVAMARAVSESVKRSLEGFEWAIGIPGSIGGSVRGNAGCYSREMKDVIESVEVIETGAAGVRTFTLDNAACDFGYRTSVFKYRPDWTIISATLLLHSGDAARSQDLVRTYAKKRATSQAIGAQCAGCIFKNPAGDRGAGALIDARGLKGKSIGHAMISDKHANFIVNAGGASAEDVVMLIALIKERVHTAFGVQLEEEIQYVGF